MTTLTNPGQWQIFAGSSIGKAHIDSDLPNQDSFFYQRENDFCVAVVCDGAGSATFSQDGSKFFAQTIGEMLNNLGKNLTSQNFIQVAEKITSQIPNVLAKTRSQLQQQLTAESSLRDYHTTITAVLLLPKFNQALLIQVGDSPLLTSQFAIQNSLNNTQAVDYFEQIQLFGDDSKNEYVNETHFITQDNWQDFLRVEWLDVTSVNCLALMSDGCADLVLEGAKIPPTIYRPFFGNLLFNLCQSQTTEQGNAIIEQTLANPATYRLTGDDKTLIVLLKNRQTYQHLEPIINEISQNNPVATPANSVWHNAEKISENLAKNHEQNQPFNIANNISHTQTTPQVQNPLTNELALPQATPMSATGKQRRNVAVMASLAVLVGTGALAWVNLDKIQSLINPSINFQSPIVASATPPKTVSNLPPLTYSPVNQAFSLNTDLQIDNVSPHFFIQTVMAIPKNNPATVLPLYDGHESLADTTLINPNRLPFNQSSTGDKGDILEQRLSLHYQFKCQPILPKNQPSYQALGINFSKEYDYQYCRIDFTHLTDKQDSFVMVLEPKISRILIEGGIGQMLGHETTPSIEKQKQQLGDKRFNIVLYYLPSNFSANTVNTATAKG